MSKPTVKVKIELTKAELEIVLRGVTRVMDDECAKRRLNGYRASKRLETALILLGRLEGLSQRQANQEGSR